MITLASEWNIRAEALKKMQLIVVQHPDTFKKEMVDSHQKRLVAIFSQQVRTLILDARPMISHS